MKKVFNFSGGLTSAYMVLKYYQADDMVIFQDTGREHPKTYKFINDFEAFEGIPITRISRKDSGEAFSLLLEEKKYKIFPNRMRRFCTDELKIKVVKRYLRGIGIRTFENFIGFRYDEPTRVLRKQPFKNVIDKFPLYDDGTTKEIVNSYWDNKPYTLGIPHILGNCTLCFMKGKNAILAILREYPELADVWIEDEKKSAELYGVKNRRTYFPNTTIEELRNYAQNNLFKDYPLDNLGYQYNCECNGL